MDDTDRQHYNNILSQLTKNQRTLQDQNNAMLKTNAELIEKFNQRLKNIRINEQNLIETDSKQETLNTITQLTLLTSSLISLYEEIETSLTFCKSYVLHESIISFDELKNLFELYKINIQIYDFCWEAINFVKPFCKLHDNIIDIILEIPNYLNSNSPILQFSPLPIVQGENQFILNETFQNILYDDKKLSYVTNCIKNHDNYYCKLDNQPVNPCLKNLLIKKTHENCQLYPLKYFPKVTTIPNSNILIINVESEKVFVNCPSVKRYINFGLYKLANNNCIIDGVKTNSTYEAKSEIPLPEINQIDINIINHNKEVKMHDINKIEIENIRLRQIEEITSKIYTNKKPIVISLCITLIVIITVIIIIIIIRHKKHRIVIPKELELTERPYRFEIPRL